MLDKRGQTEAHGNFKIKAFSKDVLLYSVGNGVILVLGLIQGFIIPKYLSVANYGYWQLFTLYIQYVGVLQLGYLDGLLTHWAGKQLAQIRNEARSALIILIVLQMIVLIPLALIVYTFMQPPLQWLGIMLLLDALIMNGAFFFVYAEQALKQFRFLSLLNAFRGLSFFILVMILIATGNINYQNIIYAFLITSMLFASMLAIKSQRYLRGRIAAISSLLLFAKENINLGFFILVGNLVLVLFLSIDRFIISFFLPIEQFAQYAFALSIVSIAYTFIRALSEVFFPYIAGASSEIQMKVYQLGKPLIVISWAVLMVMYFPLSALISLYLPQYTASLLIMKLLIGVVGFSCMIQVLQVNYFRILLKQRAYFVLGISALITAVILIILTINLSQSLEIVAIIMVVAFCIWYTTNELFLKPLTMETNKRVVKRILIMICYYLAFWVASMLMDWFLFQMLIYVVFLVPLTIIFFRNELKEIATIIAKQIRSKEQPAR